MTDEEIAVKRPEQPNREPTVKAITVVTEAFNRMLDAATVLAFPEYRNTISQVTSKAQRKKVNSNLYLHMLLIFNAYFSVAWFIVMFYTCQWKSRHLNTSLIFQFVTSPLIYIVTLIELLRLYLGARGNKNESVPALVGCFILSVFPQMLITLYFVFLQRLRDYTMPIEYAVNAIMLLFMIPEVALSFTTAKAIIKSQAADFFLAMDVAEERKSAAIR